MMMKMRMRMVVIYAIMNEIHFMVANFPTNMLLAAAFLTAFRINRKHYLIQN